MRRGAVCQGIPGELWLESREQLKVPNVNSTSLDRQDLFRSTVHDICAKVIEIWRPWEDRRQGRNRKALANVKDIRGPKTYKGIHSYTWP